MSKDKSVKKTVFDPVDPGVNFSDLEKKLLDKWYKNGIVNKYLNLNKTSQKIYSFLDGPITANNPMGVHHAWGRTYKDLWQRFYNMKGYKQRFQNGFDCQGLWVEVEVEKELGLRNKKDIENLIPGNKKESIAKFVELCKQRVEKYSQIQTEQSKRLGYFMDWDNSYFTLTDENNYMIWHFLKKCAEKDLIYKGNDVVPWCPRCETAISEHEILTEDYKEVTHKSLFLRFPVVDKKDEYLLVWTTTPWTVPANIAVAVATDLEYALFENDENKYWIAKKLAEKVLGINLKTIKTVKGSELVGLKYTSAFDDLPAVRNVIKEKGFHEVIGTDPMIMPISEEEGTGLVHTSTGTGSEDHKLGKKLNLPLIPAIEYDAKYLPGFGFLEGKNAKSNPDLIIDHLNSHQNGKYLYKTENYSHRYPACWRCKKELVFKLTDEWYIAIDPVRQDMIEVTKKIKWLPGFGLKRELDWLNNMHDWLISKKNRYWGLALPIWVCNKCSHFDVIGSKEELQEKAVEGWDAFSGHTPHKPWIDEVKIKCSDCGSTSTRIDDVGNPWLDAGIVAYSTVSKDNKSEPIYLNDKEDWKKWIPADFITESFPGQFKNWFYSLIAMSTVLEKREPFKTVLGFATLLAEDGRPMHKSWGNAIEFNEGAEKIGVDVMRWMYARQNPAENLLFGYKIADETRRRFHLKLWNVYNFFVTYANLDGWQPSGKESENDISLLDKWIISRLNEVIDKVTEYLNDYDCYTASIVLEVFVEDLSNWYIRRSRERTGYYAEKSDKENFYSTTYLILIKLSALLAPFTPFISDTIYTNLSANESVHFSEWPEKSGKPDYDLISEMKTVRNIVEKVHSLRKEKNIPVRQPLNSLTVKNINIKEKDLVQLMKDELNIKNIKFENGKGELNLTLDTKITPQLEEEAKTRELIRKIQEQRKQLGVRLDQKVNVQNDWLPQSVDMLNKIIMVTLANTLTKGDFAVKITP